MRPRSLSFHLEPTFRCNLGCEACPRFSSEDPHLDMPLETYLRIVKGMAYAHSVDFTGWGESLLHPNIYEMIRLAKQAGCVTAMTTNGSALTPNNCGKLLDAGMDSLAVSVDGMTAETFNRIRIGADFDKLVQNLKVLGRLISERQSAMELSIAFTIQQDNAAEIGLIPSFMQEVGSRVLHLKHLNAISSAADWKRSFLQYRLEPRSRAPFWRDPLRRLEKEIGQVIRASENLGITVRMHSEYPMTDRLTPRHCLAAPLEAVYFSFEGKLSPCCYFGHHVARYFQGAQYPPDALFFGDITADPIETIWEVEAFQDFRKRFMDQTYPQECQKCYLLYGK